MSNNLTKKLRYTFNNNVDDNDDKSEEFNFFYQICTFPNLYTNKYHMRKFVTNNNNEFIAINDYYLNKKQCKKFFLIKKQHEYQCYNTYSLDEINYPTLNDILKSKSKMLTENYDYSGYAPF